MMRCVGCGEELTYEQLARGVVCGEKCLEVAIKYDQLFTSFGKDTADQFFQREGTTLKGTKERV